jgi:hypothetical protein
MYQYRGMRDNERVVKGQKNNNNNFPRGFKADNFLTNKVTKVRRELMNELVNDRKNNILQ